MNAAAPSSVAAHRRVPLPLRSVVLATGAVAIVGSAAGCAASATPTATTSDLAVTATATPSTTAEPTVTDAESCAAFGDVLTILQNAMVGVTEERMTQQEYNGWLRLATRVLDRVPTSGEGAVSDAITELKEAAPPIALGAMGSTNLGTHEWYSSTSLADACAAAGTQLSAEGFTGG
ncbi:hypothetical protein JNB63_03060 [Microbacterium trichothecenolyticum]|uniref:hypothetical protein n=1 Tax=Microbacterium trichothecenolyticum TaxID=69370 RepID=UPI001C6EEE94|nr:hypothetical protein [Microbacterium trichothecenolyticum]MBW9119063.1 hypothetical protein [Microbacterium trichothecenolyticum]